MARAPQKINSYIVFDFETGGLDKKEGLHSQKYPITEFAGIAINGVTLEEILRYDDLVKPYDNSLIYDPIAAQLTGITRELCEKDGIPLRKLVENICQLAEEANIHKSKIARPVLVAHNGAFDKQFFQDIFRRAEVDASKFVDGDKDHYGNFQPTVLDTIDFAKMLWADITETTTKFNLAACCERAGIDLVDGHRAMNDVIPLADFVRYVITRIRSGSGQVEVSGGNISVKHRVNFEW
jgi:DNA polymerase III epsilon subunit-like protein